MAFMLRQAPARLIESNAAGANGLDSCGLTFGALWTAKIPGRIMRSARRSGAVIGGFVLRSEGRSLTDFEPSTGPGELLLIARVEVHESGAARS